MIPQIIAHRGNKSVAPENTLAAFASAVAAGAQSIEMDIVRASDGTPVVIHDETLDATTSGNGLVGDYTVEHIQSLDAGSWFSNGFQGAQVPTLEQFAQFMAGHPDVEILLEFKGDWDTASTSGVVDILKRAGVLEQSILQSFSAVTVASLAIVAPDARRGVLMISQESQQAMGWGSSDPSAVQLSEIDAFIETCTHLGIYTVNPFIEDVVALPSLVEKVHDRGLKVQVWTANQPEKWEFLVSLGVDGIITDRPDALNGWYSGRLVTV